MLVRASLYYLYVYSLPCLPGTLGILYAICIAYHCFVILWVSWSNVTYSTQVLAFGFGHTSRMTQCAIFCGFLGSSRAFFRWQC